MYLHVSVLPAAIRQVKGQSNISHNQMIVVNSAITFLPGPKHSFGEARDNSFDFYTIELTQLITIPDPDHEITV